MLESLPQAKILQTTVCGYIGTHISYHLATLNPDQFRELKTEAGRKTALLNGGMNFGVRLLAFCHERTART